jgi:hypothetical protein
MKVRSAKAMVGVLMLAGCGSLARPLTVPVGLTGSLMLNGAPYSPRRCSSLQREDGSGFNGVELIDTSGLRTRLVLRPDGAADFIVFPRGSTRGITLPDCGSMQLGAPHEWINSGDTMVAVLSGSANLDCRSDKWTVAGSIQFSGCYF